MAERLTIKQMAEKYPNQWIGLTDIKYDNDTIVSAIVTYKGLDQETVQKMQFLENKCVAWYTTEDALPIGAIGDVYAS